MHLFSEPVYETPGGGSAAAGGAAGGAAAAAAGSPGATVPSGLGGGTQEGSGAAAAAWKAPDFIPETLRGTDLPTTFEKLGVDWKRQRDAIAALPAAPKTADEYSFTPSDKAKGYFPADLAKDPVFAQAKAAALKAGLPAAAFQAFVGTFYDGLVDAKALTTPYNAEAERDALIGERARFMSPEAKDAEIRPILSPLLGFLDGLKTQNVIDPAGYAALGSLLDTAPGVRALAKIVELATKGRQGLNPGGDPGGGAKGMTPADLRARQRDARNDPDSPMFDRAFKQETQRLYQEVYK